MKSHLRAEDRPLRRRDGPSSDRFSYRFSDPIRPIRPDRSETMCDLIEVECSKAETDLVSACKQSLAHGALLATRYVLAEIDFNAGPCDKLKVRIYRYLPLPRPFASRRGGEDETQAPSTDQAVRTIVG